MSDTFPRQSARTQRFTLGVPRNLSVTDDGTVVFLRSRGGEDPVNCLWALDPGSSEPRLLADPVALVADGTGDDDLPAAEKARRERAREGAGGIVGYAVSADGETVVFALGGEAYVTRVSAATTTRVPTAGPVFDPRPDPQGERFAYVMPDGAGDSLRVVDIGSGHEVVVGDEDDELVSWGSAEFIAAEEMRRSRGYWWSPDGRSLVAARVDVSPIQQWFIADPANPGNPPTAIRYPAAGTNDADVRLFVVDAGGSQAGAAATGEHDGVEIVWDRDALPYVVDVGWARDTPLTVVVQSRDQRTMQVLAVDPATGTSSLLREIHHPTWVEIVAGTPCWWDGALVTVEERTFANGRSSRALVVDGEPVTPADEWVRSAVGASGEGFIYTASTEPADVHVRRLVGSADGGWESRIVLGGPGVHGAVVGGDDGVLVTTSATIRSASVTTVIRPGQPDTIIDSEAASPLVEPSVELLRCGERGIPTAVLFPSGSHANDGALPVLMDPYGGPHAQRVVASRNAFLSSQWLADQGFVVIVADGRGTPAIGDGWEMSVRGDLAGPVLDDQIAALEAVAAAHPGRLDLSRVAIRGWSFGGYLAALAVLRRPDVFHAAVAGAPVTDWRLYDTHYTERYLGHPDMEPENYDRTSLLADAASLQRPLLLVHGLADDNVVAAHTLQLSSALLAAGRPHQVLPLSGVTHMTPQEEVAENLLLLQVEFLKQALATG